MRASFSGARLGRSACSAPWASTGAPSSASFAFEGAGLVVAGTLTGVLAGFGACVLFLPLFRPAFTGPNTPPFQALGEGARGRNLVTICDHPRLLRLVAARRPLAHKGISFASRHGGSRQLLRICNGEPDILPRLPTWTVLPQGYGYIDLVRLEVDDVEAALAAIRHPPPQSSISAAIRAGPPGRLGRGSAGSRWTGRSSPARW